MANQGDDDKVMKRVFNAWTLDEEFGRQFLNGYNPVMLQNHSANTMFDALFNQRYWRCTVRPCYCDAVETGAAWPRLTEVYRTAG